MLVEFRPLGLADMEETARLFREAFDETYPSFPVLHTAKEDHAYFEHEVYRHYALTGAFAAERMLGFMGVRPGWIEMLYIRRDAQAQGIGRTFIGFAKSRESQLRLWTFVVNSRARRFYEANGFVAIRETDGAGNEEKQPDVLYEWRRATGFTA